jgi:hypothetical protein
LIDPFAAEMTESDKESIKFNGHHYDSWKRARDAHSWLSGKGKSGVWSIVKLVNKDPQDLDGPFELRCRHCNQTCQLGNPSKWFKQHSGSCKGSNPVPGSTQSAVGSGPFKKATAQPMKQLGSTAQQQQESKDLFFKAMVTSCIPFTFVENGYLQRAFAAFGVTTSASLGQCWTTWPVQTKAAWHPW